MKPFRIFLFGISVFLVLAIVSALFADHPPVFFGYSLKVPSLSQFTQEKHARYKDISPIIHLSKLINDTAVIRTGFIIPSPEKGKPVSGFVRQKSRLNADSLQCILREIEYPYGRDTLLYPFFRALYGLSSNNKLIRIVHYGDSQIEGDRITSYLRNQLQMQFGGCGTGLLPVVATSPASMSYMYEISGNWVRYSPYQAASASGNFNKYGPLLNYAKLSGRMFEKDKDLEGWIKLKYSNLPYPLTQDFKVCSFFYGYNKSPMMVELKQDKVLLDAELVPSSSELEVLHWDVSPPVKDLTIEVKSAVSPDVFCIALDGDHGVAVDNVPLRGSSGLEFSKMDMSFLQHFFNIEDVKLLILQFGVNVVPNITQNYAFYERSFFQQLTLLKHFNPGISIIVMGVSDVSRNGKDGFESYPNVEKIRDVQKSAAFEAGCAFWDTFEAMGGRNSMPSWVFANPPLAQKDFVHFNPMGAKLIGEMFYRSLMNEYEKFVTCKK